MKLKVMDTKTKLIYTFLSYAHLLRYIDKYNLDLSTLILIDNEE